MMTARDMMGTRGSRDAVWGSGSGGRSMSEMTIGGDFPTAAEAANGASPQLFQCDLSCPTHKCVLDSQPRLLEPMPLLSKHNPRNALFSPEPLQLQPPMPNYCRGSTHSEESISTPMLATGTM